MRLLLLGLLLVGCSSSHPKLPKYVPPELPPGQAALLHGHGGTTVISIDEAEVKGSGVQMANFGGNRILLAPGQHRFVIKVSTSSSMSFSQSTIPMAYNFEAGHSYKVGPQSLFSREPVLFDETQGVPVSANE